MADRDVGQGQKIERGQNRMISQCEAFWGVSSHRAGRTTENRKMSFLAAKSAPRVSADAGGRPNAPLVGRSEDPGVKTAKNRINTPEFPVRRGVKTALAA